MVRPVLRMASAAKQNHKYWIYGNIICLYLLVGFYSIYMDNHKTQSPVLKLKCSWLIQKCLGETASPAYLGCISDGQNKIVDRCAKIQVRYRESVVDASQRPQSYKNLKRQKIVQCRVHMDCFFCSPIYPAIKLIMNKTWFVCMHGNHPTPSPREEYTKIQIIFDKSGLDPL